MTIEIVEKDVGHVVEIEEHAPMWKMPMILGRDFQKLQDCLKAQDAECVEAPYTRYVDVEWESEMGKSKFAMFLEIFTKKWHFFAGMPCSKEDIEAQGECKTSTIGMRKYVKTVHVGPYQKVGNTYKQMQEWIIANQINVEHESIEFYMNDPRETKKDELETVIYIPLA